MLTYMPILAVVLFLSAIRLRLVVISAVLAVVMIPAAYMIGVKTGAVKSYQQERINVILDPENADQASYWLSHVAVDFDGGRRWTVRIALVCRALAERFEVSARATH